MLVAIAATTIMVLFLNQIFGHMSAAVSIGQALSTTIENARTITPQLDADAKQMVGPSDNGVLVIVNRQIPFIGPDNAANTADDLRLTNNAPTAMQISPRADQVMWIRNRNNEEPLCPQGPGNLSNDSTASYIRIWYGHALRTNQAGIAPLGASGDLGTALGNLYAADWILGRQALFLQETPPTGQNINGAYFSDPTTPYGGDLPAPNRFHFFAVTDIAQLGLANETPNGALVGDAYDATANRAGDRLWQTGTGSDSASYATRALNNMFVTERLRANPTPLNTYESWRMAQMHPILASNVLYFAVDFAGDYNGAGGLPDGEIDTVGGAANAPVQWYGFFADPDALVVPPPVGFVAPLAANPGPTPIYDPAPVAGFPNADAAFVFRHGDGTRKSQNNTPPTNWPYMLRIRYRVIDRHGKLTGADGLPGKLFEQIIRVNRE